MEESNLMTHGFSFCMMSQVEIIYHMANRSGICVFDLMSEFMIHDVISI